MFSEQAILRDCLTWLGEQAEEFVAPAAKSLSPRTAKPLGELAFLVAVLDSTRFCTDWTAFETVRKILLAASRTVTVRAASPTRSWSVALHCLLDATLRRDAPEDAAPHHEMVRRAVAAKVLDHEEVLPYQSAEMALFLAWAGFKSNRPRRRVRGGMLMDSEPSSLLLTERTAYQLTHDIMFSTRADPGGAPPIRPGRAVALSELLGDLIRVHVHGGHWDLVGELLLCWDCLRLPSDESYQEGWELFASVRHDDGSFPGPPPVPASTDVRTAFRHRYHTTLVAALAAHARARRLPVLRSTESVSGHPRRTAVGHEVLALLGGATSWLLDGYAAGRSDPARTAAALVGTWVGAATGIVPADRHTTLVEQVAENAVNDEWSGVPPTLSLVTAALLGRQGCRPPELWALVGVIVKALRHHAPASPEDDLAWCEKRSLLAAIGLLPAPPLLAPVDLLRYTRLGMRPSTTELTRALLAAGSASGYGTRSPVTAGEVPSRLLLAHGLRALHDGELILGCELVRNAHLLHPLPRRRITQVVEHLGFEQSSDGGFGVPVHDEDGHHRSATTLTCVQTLAELNGSFRLFPSLITLGECHV